MSIILVLCFLALILNLVAQFGGKLTARNSLVWWLIFSFLLFCLISPASLLPLAHALGIQLVSNFVFAAMLLFLVFQAIQESAFSTQQSRKLRDFVSSHAADSFCQKQKSRSGSSFPRVVICMPCYNESEYLPTLISHLKEFKEKIADLPFEFIFSVVNDGSSDESRAILENNIPMAYTSHLTNVGVAGALLTSFKVAELLDAKYVIQCDADGQHPLHFIPKLVEAAEASSADLLIGSRFMTQVEDRSSTELRRFGSKVIIAAIRLFQGSKDVRDPTSGFRVYSKKARQHLLKTMPDEYPEPESIALLLLQNLKVAEFPVVMSERQGGVSSLGGIAGARFMLKVISALLGLRLRTIFS